MTTYLRSLLRADPRRRKYMLASDGVLALPDEALSYYEYRADHCVGERVEVRIPGVSMADLLALMGDQDAAAIP